MYNDYNKIKSKQKNENTFLELKNNIKTINTFA